MSLQQGLFWRDGLGAGSHMASGVPFSVWFPRRPLSWEEVQAPLHLLFPSWLRKYTPGKEKIR